MYYELIKQFDASLGNLAGFLKKAQALAEAKKFDVDNFLHLRLAPDMFQLTRQIQSTCDTAKNTAARLSGKEAPKHEDNETSVEELLARIEKTRTYLGTFAEADFAETATRKIELSFLPGMHILGQDYAMQFALPNFYFHMSTSYNLLRGNGVEIGKRDFIGEHLRFHPNE